MARTKTIKPAIMIEARLSKPNVFRATTGALAACALILSAGLPLKAHADVTDTLLEIMKTKGDITEAEYKNLKARHEAEKAAQKKAAPDNGVVQYGLKGLEYRDPPPPPPGWAKDGAVTTGPYVTKLPKGVGIRIGDVEFETKGDISFFGIEDFPQRRLVPIGGGLLSSGLENDSNSIRAGLLPSSLQFEVRTRQMGYDIAAHFSMFVGGNSNAFVNIVEPNGLGQSDIDFRQVYGTVGTPTLGTVKFGRDLGIFGGEAILFDATIFGSGTPQGNFAPGNTTLGRIGIGYVYADWIPQISYTTPNFHGLTATVGIFTPINEVNFAGLGFSSIGLQTLDGPFPGAPNSAFITGHDAPMVQGRLKYVKDYGVGAKLTAWTSALFQNHQVEVGDTPVVFGKALGDSISVWGVDGGVKLDWAGFSLVGYAYTGDGLGEAGLFWNGVSINGDTRRSDGGYVQGSYTFWDCLTLGGSWGISRLGFNPGVDDPHLFKDIEATIGFAKYKLTDWVQFQFEYVHTSETNHQIDGRIHDDAVIAGTTFFW